MPGKPSPEKKALDYVEGLGLNSVYDEAVVARRRLESHYGEINNLRSTKRHLEAERIDLEMELTERERAANPDLSVAAFERHMKVVINTDTTLRGIRDQIMEVAGQLDYHEHEADLLNTDIKVAVARLSELGGYFQFMAVIKGASIAKRSQDEGNPWI